MSWVNSKEFSVYCRLYFHFILKTQTIGKKISSSSKLMILYEFLFMSCTDYFGLEITKIEQCFTKKRVRKYQPSVLFALNLFHSVLPPCPPHSWHACWLPTLRIHKKVFHPTWVSLFLNSARFCFQTLLCPFAPFNFNCFPACHFSFCRNIV